MNCTMRTAANMEMMKYLYKLQTGAGIEDANSQIIYFIVIIYICMKAVTCIIVRPSMFFLPSECFFTKYGS